MSRSKCDVYRSLPVILSGTGGEFTFRHMPSQKSSQLRLSYDFEIFKAMSHNLELLNFQKMLWFVGVYKKNESATDSDPRTDGPEGWLIP